MLVKQNTHAENMHGRREYAKQKFNINTQGFSQQGAGHGGGGAPPIFFRNLLPTPKPMPPYGAPSPPHLKMKLPPPLHLKTNHLP